MAAINEIIQVIAGRAGDLRLTCKPFDFDISLTTGKGDQPFTPAPRTCSGDGGQAAARRGVERGADPHLGGPRAGVVEAVHAVGVGGRARDLGVFDEQPMPDSLISISGRSDISHSACTRAAVIESWPQPAHSVDSVPS